MSGICGFFHRDGSPAAREVLQRMVDAAPHRSRHGCDLWVDGPVALAHQHLNHLPPQRSVLQPLHDSAARLSVVLHGRIDNRRELVSLMGHPAGSGSLPADAALVLQAYQRWGSACSDRLVGDFAFVIWDANKRTLFASRDPSGCIPFYYAVLDELMVFGSQLSQVLAHPAVPRRVDEGMAAEFLCTAITSKRATLYRDIARLEPGFHMTVGEGSCVVARHWHYLPLQQILYRDPQDYLDHFLQLFERAVEDRLDCAGPPGIMLSGGLDSPSVAGMAQQLLDRRGGGERVHSVSLTSFDDSENDEGPYIRMVSNKWQLQSEYFPVEPQALPDWQAQVRASGDLPQFPNDIPNELMRAAAGRAGVSTLFTGSGADGPLTGSRYGHLDLLRARKFAAIGQELSAQRQEEGLRSMLQNLMKGLGWPLLPQPVRAWVERSRRLNYRSPFLTDKFIAGTGLDERRRADVTQGQFSNPATWRSWCPAHDGVAIFGVELLERENALHGLAGAHPFLDRRLLEYLFALPTQAKRERGQGKQLLVRSGLLPEQVARDRMQGDYSLAIRRALCSPAVQNTLAHLAIAEMGWVHQDRVTRAVAIVRETQGQSIWTEPLPHIYLWLVFSLELWFQTAMIEANNG